MNRRFTIPVAILAAAGVVIALLVWTRPRAVPEAPVVRAPVVSVQRVEPGEVSLVVQAQGTVAPRTESEIVSQVSGEVVWISPSLVPGGFFEAGDVLLRIDPIDYEAALETARAALARAESEANRARKERGRQRRLADRSVASQSHIDDAENELRVADAVVREALARVGMAERDLLRTKIRAPYAGRVRSENIDRGQFVARGESVARVYAVDYAEVRLPIPDRELRYLEVPLGYREVPEVFSGESRESGVEEGDLREPLELPAPVGPRVKLTAEFAGENHEWDANVVRTEGELDPKSRMVTVVVRIEDPYGRGADGGRPPLAVGLFVDAEIEGRRLGDVVVLPRTALQPDSRVLVIDADRRVRFRPVEILREERDRVLVSGGLVAGELVCTSPLPGAVEGMRVRVEGESERENAENAESAS